jgi:hypothetical protein
MIEDAIAMTELCEMMHLRCTACPYDPCDAGSAEATGLVLPGSCSKVSDQNFEK